MAARGFYFFPLLFADRTEECLSGGLTQGASPVEFNYLMSFENAVLLLLIQCRTRFALPGVEGGRDGGMGGWREEGRDFGREGGQGQTEVNLFFFFFRANDESAAAAVTVLSVHPVHPTPTTLISTPSPPPLLPSSSSCM